MFVVEHSYVYLENAAVQEPQFHRVAAFYWREYAADFIACQIRATVRNFTYNRTGRSMVMDMGASQLVVVLTRLEQGFIDITAYGVGECHGHPFSCSPYTDLQALDTIVDYFISQFRVSTKRTVSFTWFGDNNLRKTDSYREVEGGEF